MSLNPQQLEAVEHVHGPLLILAGAGTGKTRVLVHRIAHLVHSGLAPGRILAVTFTNKAAGEMKRRVEQLVGNKARELWVGTFHSVCVKMLRKHALEAGLAPEFVIYDATDQQSIIKMVLKELNLDEKRFPPSQIVSRISRLKDQLTGVEDWHSQAQDPFQKTVARIYEAYQKVLEANHALDFGDLIFRCVRLLEKQPAILKGYQSLWQQILIDEYQDTNHAQYRWASLLAAAHQNLCVVGDPDQSIYRWRGADLNNILNFEKDYKGAKVIRLEENYRSVQTVLKAASHVIANNELRKEKGLWSSKEGGEKIQVAALNSEKEEAKYVVEQLQKRHLQHQIAYSSMAIFYRTNAQSRPFEEMLRMAGIPYLIYGGIRFYERAEVKDALAYLRIFNLPSDSLSFKRVINVPARGIGKTTIDRVEQVAAQEGISFYEAVRRAESHAKLGAFLEWFEMLRSKMSALPLVDLLQQILETSGYIQNLSAQGSMEAQERLSNLNELMSSLHEFQESAPDPTLANYLEQVALITDLDQNAEGGVLPLMTLHLAKGLEFQNVAVVGLEEGLLPHARSQDELEELEEERRLFYVGMTRAKERLLLTHAWRRYLNGQEQYSLPSRFLEEIPAELVEKKDRALRWEQATSASVEYDEFDQRSDWEKVSSRVPSSLRGAKPQVPKGPLRGNPSATQGQYRIGLKVRHPDFGVGTVAASEKTSLGEKITVRFANGTIKKLIAEYAHIEKV